MATVVVDNVANNLRFPGQYFDAETGLHYNYFRDYDPEIGRYVESDPIGLLGGVSTYGYALQGPINGFDPDGLFTRIACANPHNWAACDAAGMSTPLTADYSCGAALVAGVGDVIADKLLEMAPVGKAVEFAGKAFGKAKSLFAKIAEKFNKGGGGKKTHLHHSDPKFMGGDPKQPLTKLDEQIHKNLHRDMNDFLRSITDEFGNHMRPQRGNSGQKIRQNFTRQERLEALRDFYRGLGAKYGEAANDFFNQHPDL